MLAEAALTRDYAQLVEFYETEVMRDQAPERRAWHIEHRLTLPVRAKQRLHTLLDMADFTPPKVAAGAPVLDLGCGSGEPLSELAKVTGGAIGGLDISLGEVFPSRQLINGGGPLAVPLP